MLTYRKAPRERGVTLIEMLIAMAIVGILMTMGYPAYTAWMQNTQIRNAAGSLQNGLQLARVGALRRNTTVQFALGPNASQQGKTTWTVTVSNGTVVQSKGAKGYQNVTTTATPAAATTVTFNGLGRVVANSDSSASITQLDIDVPTSVLPAADSRNLRITVTPGGQIRMCDPNAGSGDPRAC